MMKKALLQILGSAILLSPGILEARNITILVDGMVCAFCSQGLTKKFNAEPAVEKVDVNLGEKRVDLVVKDSSTITDETLGKIVEGAGFKVRQIERK